MVVLERGQHIPAKARLQDCKQVCDDGKVWQQQAPLVLFLHCGEGKPLASS